VRCSGAGFVGGRWAGNTFAYNTTVANVNTTIVHNTYNTTVINNVTINRVSYNGGGGGLTAIPTAQERAAAQESHVAATPVQRQHVQESVRTPALAARANGGHPAIAATARPAAFHGPGVVGAHGAAPGGAAPNAAHPATTSVAQNPAHGNPRAQAMRVKNPAPPGQPQKAARQKDQGRKREHEPDK